MFLLSNNSIKVMVNLLFGCINVLRTGVNLAGTRDTINEDVKQCRSKHGTLRYSMGNLFDTDRTPNCCKKRPTLGPKVAVTLGDLRRL